MDYTSCPACNTERDSASALRNHFRILAYARKALAERKAKEYETVDLRERALSLVERDIEVMQNCLAVVFKIGPRVA